MTEDPIFQSTRTPVQNTVPPTPIKSFSGVDTFKESFSFGIWAIRDGGLLTWGQPFFLIAALLVAMPFLAAFLGEPATALQPQGGFLVVSSALNIAYAICCLSIVGFFIDKAIRPDAPPSKPFQQYILSPLLRLFRSGFAIGTLGMLLIFGLTIISRITESLGGFNIVLMAVIILASIYLFVSKTFLIAPAAVAGSKKPLVDSYTLSRNSGSEIFVIILLFAMLQIGFAIALLTLGFFNYARKC